MSSKTNPNISDSQTEKIAIIGLSNAGKTSILKILTREFEMLTTLKPTSGVERNFLEIFGSEIIIWDFGGQEMYRKKYLQEPDRYFGSIAYVFYVIDIQDPTLLGENIMYFQSVYKKIIKFSPKAQFIVLFHKLDPELEHPQHVEELQDKFLDAVESEDIDLLMYYTSIHNPLSIVQAFSQPLFDNTNISKALKQAFQAFVDNYEILFISLLTKSSFELGYFISNKFEDKYPNQMPAVFNAIFKKIDPEKKSGEIIELEVEKVKTIISKFIIRGKGKGSTGSNYQNGNSTEKSDFLFLILGYDEEALLEKDGLEVALNHLDENLQKIFNSIDTTQILARLKLK